MKVHKEGLLFIAIFGVVTLLCFAISSFFGLIFFAITSFVVYFFRDPSRILPDLDDTMIVSPADGIVTDISPDIINGGEFIRVSIFLRVWDVHIMRVPVSGKVVSKIYTKGTFAHAESTKALESNENLILKIEGNIVLYVRQVAGMIARRIVCYPEIGDDVKIGARYGVIKFGSRVDLYLPMSAKILVKKGQTMIGAETVIARVENVSVE